MKKNEPKIFHKPTEPKYKIGDIVYYLDFDELARKDKCIKLNITQQVVQFVCPPVIEYKDCDDNGNVIAVYYEERDNLYDVQRAKAVGEIYLFKTMRQAWDFAERMYFKNALTVGKDGKG